MLRGRITGFVGAEDSVSYTYDDNGNVLTVSDKNGVIKREYDALNRIIKLTDTFGKTIQYTYDAVGNLASIIYPDNTAVNYTYDANNNLVSVTDWANRVTSYTYDVNNMVVGVTKPDGSVTTTVYDNAQRIVSTDEKTASGTVITGFEYTYDTLSRIVEEKHLAENTKICYTYDSLSRVTNRTIRNECDEVISSENYSYDAAGNITDAPNSCFIYDTNNRLISHNGYNIFYDMDGNMLSNGYLSCEFDSGNRLISAGGHTYTYNAEDVRIRNLCSDADTTYTYNTNCRLSQLLCKTTNGITTKYVYGLGLIGEEKCGEFKTYHFDFRGSTVAITDECGNITDTFKYDTYGKLISRTGDSFVIFGYNGRDGVITDKNGLYYMRARYYSPDLRRFVNADILRGGITDSTSLNRYAYVNGNPVSSVDPFGLCRETISTNTALNNPFNTQFGSDIFTPKIMIRGKEYNKCDINRSNKNMLMEKLAELLKYYSNDTTVTWGLKQTLYSDATTNISLSTSLSKGSGSFEYAAIFDEHVEFLRSKEFSTFLDDFTYSIASDKTLSFEYSGQIDDFSSFAINLTAGADLTTSCGYEITTQKDDWSFSTSFEIEKTVDWTKFNNRYQSSSGNSSQFDWSSLKPVVNVGVALGLSIWTLITLGETFITQGAGVGDDQQAIDNAIRAWERVFN